jgi:hypothetical protein
MLEDYRTSQQSLGRHDASIVSMRNWMMVAVATYFGLVGRLAEITQTARAHTTSSSYMWPPLLLWFLSYVFTAYERGNSRALVEVIRIVERAHLPDNREELDGLSDRYLPTRERIPSKVWHKALGFYIPALTDVPVFVWHCLLLVFVFGTGWAMFPSLLCPIQCRTQLLVAWLVFGAFTLVGWALRKAGVSSAQRRMLSDLELKQLRARE